MTPKEIKKDRATIAAVPVGPWAWVAQKHGYYNALVAPDGTEVIDDGSAGGEYNGMSPASPVARFIAASRTRWQVALDEAEKVGPLQAEVARLTAQLAALTAPPDPAELAAIRFAGRADLRDRLNTLETGAGC